MSSSQVESGTNQAKSTSTFQRRFLVINGDDFGFSSGVNQAIVTAHQKGVLTSTSLMVTGEAFEEAVALAKANPSLAVGLHLVVCCGRSVLPPSQIPHLVNEHGYFLEDPTKAGLRYQFDQAAVRELQLEIAAQLEKFRQTGLPLSHVDGHLHLHAHPVVLRHLVSIASEYGVRIIRLPYEEVSFTLKIDKSNFIGKQIEAFIFAQLRRNGERLLRANQIQFVDRVYGLLQTQRITESYLLQLIPQIKSNFVEIYSHPAIVRPGEPSNSPIGLGFSELEALLSDRVRETILQSGFELTNYAEFFNSPAH